MPSTIADLHRELSGRGLTVLAVNLGESRATVAAWVADRRLPVQVLLDADGRAAADYRVTSTPTVVLIDRQGRLVGRATGPRPWTGKHGQALLIALLAHTAR